MLSQLLHERRDIQTKLTELNRELVVVRCVGLQITPMQVESYTKIYKLEKRLKEVEAQLHPSKSRHS